MARIMAAALAVLASAGTVQASCINAVMYDFEAFSGGEKKPLTRLKYNTPIKLCITSEATGFVQVLDTPAIGNIQVLYPKVPADADPDNAEYAPIEGQVELCLGGGRGDDFVLFQPESEGPTGTLAITVTLDETLQLPANEWGIPGVVRSHINAHRMDNTSCEGRNIFYINYSAER